MLDSRENATNIRYGDDLMDADRRLFVRRMAVDSGPGSNGGLDS